MSNEVSIEHTTIYDEYQLLEDRHAALVAAVEELMSLDYEDDFDQGKFFKAWGRVEQALVAAQDAPE